MTTVALLSRSINLGFAAPVLRDADPSLSTTPHMATMAAHDVRTQQIVRNIAQWRRGGDLFNRVDSERGYRRLAFRMPDMNRSPEIPAAEQAMRKTWPNSTVWWRTSA